MHPLATEGSVPLCFFFCAPLNDFSHSYTSKFSSHYKLLTASYTASQDGQVPQVSVKLIFPEQGTPEGSQQRLIKVNDGTALPADEVMMTPLLHRVVSNPALSQVGLGYQTQPF